MSRRSRRNPLSGRPTQDDVRESQLRLALGPLAPPDEGWTVLASACLRQSPKAVRLNRLGPGVRPEDLPFPTQPVPWYPADGRLVVGQQRPAGHLLYATGGYYVQDAGSLLAVAAMDLRPGDLVCDVCASPGGKATAILDRLGTTGGVLANEAIRSRIAALRLNLARHGATRYVVTQADPAELADRLAGQFDSALVDAPCSGQSLMGRRQQTAGAYAESTIAHCASRQRRILDAAVRLARPGGSLVYATCTFSWLENEQQVIDLLDRHRDWVVEPVDALSPWQSPSPAPRGCYRLWPHLHASAGAFACRLRNQGAEPGQARRFRRPSRQGKLVGRFGRWRPDILIRSGRTRSEVWPDDVPSVLTAVEGFGPEAEFRKGRTWFPAYALAMRRDGRFVPGQAVELDVEQAACYVRGEPVRHGARGWAVATYQSKPLGWVRGSGRELANHLPTGARIRSPIV